MSIKSGHTKIEDYFFDGSVWRLISRWTHWGSVDCDGVNLNTKVEEIETKIQNVSNSQPTMDLDGTILTITDNRVTE